MNKRKVRHKRNHPSGIVALSFAGVILAGSLLLALPIAGGDGTSVGGLAAAFTATSGTCVTGLVVGGTGETFSTFGHVVLILLIQIGGLGTMTASLLVYTFLGKRLSLKGKVTLSEAINEESVANATIRLARHALAITFCCEAVGALLLTLWTFPRFGPMGIWYAVFLSVSAFCNSGMDIFQRADSLISLNDEPYLLLVVGALIIVGGLGYYVISDMMEWRGGRNGKHLHLHSKVVLVVSGLLLALGTLLFYFFERDNPSTLGNMDTSQRIVNALFQAITPRTAGFAALPQAELSNAGFLLTMLLMFIGASPSSTGGGIKTTTFALLVMTVVSVIRGKRDVEIGQRRINGELLRKALAIITLFFAIVVAATIAICAIESQAASDRALMDVGYEVISALCTVGLSTGITASLAPLSQIILILSMYLGRVGPLTLLLALASAEENSAIRLPEERIIIG